MKITRKITDKMLCFRSNFTSALHLDSKLKSETYYRPNGFNSLYMASCDVKEAVRREVFFKLRK